MESGNETKRAMAQQGTQRQPLRYGVEPVDAELEMLDPPYCPHGPTLVFERYYADRTPRKFFACAVHRDRKGCPFFHWVDEHLTAEKRERWRAEFEANNSQLDRLALSSSCLARIRASASSDRLFCYDCATLSLKGAPEHREHKVKLGVTDRELREPSCLLVPIGDRKAQAQFHFSESTTEFLVSELKRLGFSAVVCIGTPSLHEALLRSDDTSSLLFDIDHRYRQFYPPTQYLRFNMFNCFFYDNDGLEHFQTFLSSSSNVAVVVDPPFGGLVRVLARGLRKIYQLAGKELPTLLVFPYFMEEHVSAALPSLRMSDYQVTYRNHKSFGETTRKKSRPSPVRLFTNLAPPGLRLPPEENYRFCAPCNRYVSAGNAHCEKCNACTSKDGRSYRHCDGCGRCVKPGRVHCGRCQRCLLPGHACGAAVGGVGCHVCGSTEHKRRDCPERSHQAERGARLGGGGGPRKRRRKLDVAAGGHGGRLKAVKRL